MGLPERYKEGQRVRKWFWFGAIAAAVLATYSATFVYLWERWMSDTQYSLAFLVPFVSGYFTWKKWPELRATTASPTGWGLALVAFALLLHVGGEILDISGPSSFSMLLALVGLILYASGPATVRTLAFPLAYALFLIPLPGGVLDMVGFPLQLWASGSTAAILQAIGMDVTRSGVNLAVPGYNFQVAQACSGLSSLVALIGVTAVFAYVSDLPIRYKWALFLLALPIALAANVVRITTIALVGYYWGSDVASNAYHDMSSPILFVAAIALLFAFRRGFEWINRSRTT